MSAQTGYWVFGLVAVSAPFAVPVIAAGSGASDLSGAVVAGLLAFLVFACLAAVCRQRAKRSVL